MVRIAVESKDIAALSKTICLVCDASCGQERGDLALIGNHVIGAGRFGDITQCTALLEHPHHRAL